jgi:hypothetical protein
MRAQSCELECRKNSLEKAFVLARKSVRDCEANHHFHIICTIGTYKDSLGTLQRFLLSNDVIVRQLQGLCQKSD